MALIKLFADLVVSYAFLVGFSEFFRTNCFHINSNSDHAEKELEQSRIIPTVVKLELWKRDKGHCIICKSSNELHFGHMIPSIKTDLH